MAIAIIDYGMGNLRSVQKGFERVAQRLPECQTHVLDRVMLVDIEIAARLHAEIEEAVAREDVEHVVEERDAGIDLGLAATVDVQLDGDVGLLGRACHTRAAAGAPRPRRDRRPYHRRHRCASFCSCHLALLTRAAHR